MLLDIESCNGCGICSRECPVDAIDMVDQIPQFTGTCVLCSLCVSICPKHALAFSDNALETAVNVVVCDSCVVGCHIPENCYGACQRYMNQGGERVHARKLQLPQIPSDEEKKWDLLINTPVITAVGSGGTYPDYVPSPIAAKETRNGVDVLTVVTESPLTYSSMLVKLDTDRFIGKESAIVRHRGIEVGHVTTEQYGSKMLSIGGINIMKANKLRASKLIVTASNQEPFTLKVDGGAKLELAAGQVPVIDGKQAQSMKISCGAALMGIFGQELKQLADEIIVLDSDITGLFSESMVGRISGFIRSGVIPKGTYSTPGRYFGETGSGWGGTDIEDPLKSFDVIAPEKIKPGMTLLILEVTGTHAALLQANQHNTFIQIPLTDAMKEMREKIALNQEAALTSVMYVGGCGGSARAGVTNFPVKLNKAVHKGSVKLTIGGAKPFLMPGGGINFIVDTGKMQRGSFSWTPSPAVVAPLEYTMAENTYIALGGRKREITFLSDILKEREVKAWE